MRMGYQSILVQLCLHFGAATMLKYSSLIPPKALNNVTVLDVSEFEASKQKSQNLEATHTFGRNVCLKRYDFPEQVWVSDGQRTARCN